MQLQPLLSVIMPNYNGEAFVGAAIDSVLSQSYRNLEVVVVDDCSRDASRDVISGYARRDARVRLITNPDNLGVAATRRRAVEASRGELISSLDSDDLLLDPNKLEREVAVVTRGSASDRTVAYSGVLWVTPDAAPIRHALHAGNAPEGHIHDDLLTRSVPVPRDMTFARALYDAVGGFDASLPVYEDWDLKLRLARVAVYRFSGIDPGIAYRRHGSGLSADIEGNRKWRERVFMKHAAQRPDLSRLRRRLRASTGQSRMRQLRQRLRSLVARARLRRGRDGSD